MSSIGVLSSSLYRIVTGHAKCDALLAALAFVTPDAGTLECHELPAAFSAHEFQRHAIPPPSADRRSLKGSYFVPIDAVAALLRSRTPFFVRDTQQRALVDAAGHVAPDFEHALVVRDATKRARHADAAAAVDASALAHWKSLRALLLAIDAVVPDQMFIEIPPCPCSSCRKHVDPQAAVRLLLFPFEADTTMLQVVTSRRRGKPLSANKKAADDDSSASAHLSSPTRPAIFHITATEPAADAAPLALSSFSVPPPPAMLVDPVPSSQQLVFRLQDSMKSDIDAAVADATAAMRARYEYRLAQSQNEVLALRQQVDQLQRQLQQMSLNSTASTASATAFDAELPLDEIAHLSLSTALLQFSPPRKRRHNQQPSLLAPSAANDVLCRDAAWLELPPHSPTQQELYV